MRARVPQRPDRGASRASAARRMTHPANRGSVGGYDDARPEATALAGLRAAADSCPQAVQRRELQEMADGSLDATRASALATPMGRPLQARLDGDDEGLLQGQFEEEEDLLQGQFEEEEDLLQGQFEEEEDLLQGQFEDEDELQLQSAEGAAQRTSGLDEDDLMQGRFGEAAGTPVQRAFVTDTASASKTGLPDRLKAGVEHLSGTSLDDVRVRYNSPEPARLNALAYAQGTQIHVAPGQTRHLPHEAWHIAQQKQGRVRPTTRHAGVPVNDDARLEREADAMGRRAQAHAVQAYARANVLVTTGALDASGEAIQRRVQLTMESGRAAKVQITGRPSWRSVATDAHPPKQDYDRRHIVAWTVIKQKIAGDLTGKTEDQIRAYLLAAADIADSSYRGDVQADVQAKLDSDTLENAVEEYARARFNDPGNLFMGPKQPNRALGVRILPSFRLMAAALKGWDADSGLQAPLAEKLVVKFPFWDEDTQSKEVGAIPMNTVGDIVSWVANMALDWRVYEDWEGAVGQFLAFLKKDHPKLVAVIEEAASDAQS